MTRLYRTELRLGPNGGWIKGPASIDGPEPSKNILTLDAAEILAQLWGYESLRLETMLFSWAPTGKNLCVWIER